LAIVLRFSMKRPFRFFPQICVKPRKSNVSGRPSPRLPVPGGVPSELDQACLLGAQLQRDLRESLVQVGQEPWVHRPLAITRPTMLPPASLNDVGIPKTLDFAAQ